MANSGSSNGGLVGKLVDSLENRLVLLLVAVALGVSGNQILIKTNPDGVRPDPWTATNDAKARQEDREFMIEFVTGVKGSINDRTDLLLRPHVEHLVKAEDGWKLIYEMHEDIKVLKVEMQHIRRDIEAHDRPRQ